MKGLIVKDLYLTWKYCKSLLVIIVVFSVVSYFSNENTFFLSYPCLIAGMLPMSLCAFDEREKWSSYCQTFPLSRVQYVAAKYLMGLLALVPVLLSTGLSLGFRLENTAYFAWDDFLSQMAVILSVGLAAPAVLMPFVFKLGVEKARLIYYGVIGASFVAASLLLDEERLSHILPETAGTLAICGIALCVYCASWVLSTVFYQKREL